MPEYVFQCMLCADSAKPFIKLDRAPVFLDDPEIGAAVILP